MSNQQETNDWDITRCSKPFCCQEDAEEYMTAETLMAWFWNLKMELFKPFVLPILMVFIVELKLSQQ